MNKIALAICMVLVICGQVKAQILVGSKADSVGRISYEISVPAVPGYNDPFVSGDYLGFDGETWAKAPLENNGSDQYVFKIITYDSPIKMYYSSYSQPYNPKMSTKYLDYYSKEAKLIQFYLAGGQMLHYEHQPSLPGIDGDNILRFEWINGNTLRVYCNLLLLPKNFQEPFALSSCNEWKEKNLTVNNSSGWGYVDIDVSKNNYETSGYIGFGYGGKVDEVKVWPSIPELSQYAHKNGKGEIDGLYFQIPQKN